MKIVWLGMFTNDTIKTHFNRPDVDNWGYWMTHLCELFDKVQEVELHILIPNFFTGKSVVLKKGALTYHFFATEFDVPRYTSFLSTNPLVLTRITEEVKRIVAHIAPDLIHVHGIDHPYYAAPALALNKLYPCISTIQRFNFMATGSSSKFALVNQMEAMMLREYRFFGVRTQEMSAIIRERNPTAKLYFHNYPFELPTFLKSDSKEEEYDVVYFARVTKDKGIYDLIKSAEHVLKLRPDYRVHVLGPLSVGESTEFRAAIQRAGLQNIVIYKGNEKNPQRLHAYVAKARLCVLPTYADIMPGTIIESMLMKLPVVTYAIGGTVDLNIPGKERIQTVEKGDILGLAHAQLLLLEQHDTRLRLAEEAHRFAAVQYTHSKVVDDLLTMYREVVREISQ